MAPRYTSILASVIAATLFSPAGAADEASQEITYPSKEFSKLDTFEAVALEDADKLFGKKDYKGAFAAYKAYTFEFAKGDALPYVLLRMGRCLHILGKRNTAIKAYQDVVDYFPDDVRYAAAALYYIGQCHAQNGNEDKSIATWARLVKDKDYVNQPRSGSALASLAAVMEKRGNLGEATSYRWRTAVAFRESNVKASETARKSVVYHYAVRSPNHQKLLEFCNEVGGFGWRSRIAKPEDSPTYWSHVLQTALNARVEADQKQTACRYWADQMGDRFPDNEAVRISWIAAIRVYEKDAAKWSERMTTQFKLKPVTIGRVRAWLGHYRDDKARAAFYAEHGQSLVASLKNEEKLALANSLWHPYRMVPEAETVYRSIRTDGMDDEQLKNLANFAANFDGEEGFLRYVARMKDSLFATRTRFDFYYARSPRNGKMQEKALAEVPVLRKSPDHAQAIVWPHATLMQWQGQFEEAIKLYQAANQQPNSTWAVIDCRVALKQYDQAIKLTRRLESLGGGVAASACLKAADIYKVAGEKRQEVQQLQLVLRRYPKSSQSSTAHDRLENYGVKIIGGEAKATD